MVNCELENRLYRPHRFSDRGVKGYVVNKTYLKVLFLILLTIVYVSSNVQNVKLFLIL